MAWTFVTLCLPCPAPAQTPSATVTDLGTRGFGVDWPTFLGPTGDNKSPETGVLRDWTAEKVQVRWEMPLRMSYGNGSIAKGRFLQFDARSQTRQRHVGMILCRNSESGEPIWEYEYEYEYSDTYGYNNGPRTSPLIDEDRVYALGADGTLLCLNLANGEEIWTVATNERFGVIQNFFGVGSNPQIVGDHLVVMVGGSPRPSRIERAQGNGSGIVAFNKHTGEVAYRLSDELASYASIKVVQRDRPWCFAWMRGGLLVFDPVAGKEDFFFPWRARIVESVNASVPVVFGNRVFISETYGPGSALLDFTTSTTGEPTVVWQDKPNRRQKSMQTHWNTPIYHDGYIYGSSGRHTQNAELRCIEAETGKVMWSQPGLSRASLLYVDGHFICLDEMGGLRLIAATPEGYREVTDIQLRADDGGPVLKYPAWAAPVLSHGLLYVRGKDRLVCLEIIPRPAN